ncbi:hypothetical protein BGX26_008437 [Mortierella sp. AD094]|nr:hypothetical protein BGX26_008437 [Mortierella sp. AD094]
MLGDDYFSLFKRILAPLRSLTTLHLTIDGTIEHQAFMYLLGLTKQLRRLHIRLTQDSIVTEADEQNGIDIMEVEQTQLKEFGLEACFPFDLDIHLIPILKASPELEAWVVPNFDLTRTKEITSIIRRYCPKLHDIRLNQWRPTLKDNSVADILDSCRKSSGLRSFRSFGEAGSGFRVIKQLCANSATLVSVRMVMYGLKRFTMVQDILASCPNLREFCVDESAFEGNTGEFAVGEIGEDYHRDLYTQLAKLTRLQELDLDFSLWGELNYAATPRFSLESGLGLLEGLKELRILALPMFNGVQRKELEWMCEHWPKLTWTVGIEIARADLWWNLRSGHDDEDDASMPKQIRDFLTTQFPESRYTGYDYGGDYFF